MSLVKQSKTNFRHKPQDSNIYIYKNTYYASNLNIIKNEVQPNDWDCLSIYHGFEGTGKSTLMFQTAKYLDDSFNLDHVVFTPEQFNEVVDKEPKGSCIVWDEAITGATASQHAKTVNHSVISKLTQIRKKNMIFLLGFPYLYMLSKYFVSRALFSCQVYAKDFNDRGYFCFYDFNKTNYIYNLMKNNFSNFPQSALKIVPKNFAGTFSKKLPFSKAEYDKKKEQARLSSENGKESKGLSKEEKINIVVRARKLGISARKIARIANISYKTVYNYLYDAGVD